MKDDVPPKDNVVVLDMVTNIDIPPDRVLEGAMGKLSSVVVIGYTEDGGEYFASSITSGPEVIWILERAKKRLLELGDEE